MAATALQDVFVPEIFTPNVIKRTAEKTEFIQSGIMTVANDIPIGSGKTITMPFYQDLSGEDNVWDDTTDIALNKITMAEDTAVVLTREKAFGSTDLAAALGQDDPMDAITELVSDYWARRNQATLMATLEGAMGASNMAGNVLDISSADGAAAVIDGESFIDATNRLGDRSTDLTAIAMHSSTEAWLRKNDLIDDIQDSNGAFVMSVFQRRRVIIDDSLPRADGVYTSYLFAPGSVTMAEEVVENANEIYRHPQVNGGTNALYTRRKMVMHPRGIRWQGTASKATPANSELDNMSNWERVWEPKQIGVVKFVHRVEPNATTTT